MTRLALLFVFLVSPAFAETIVKPQDCNFRKVHGYEIRWCYEPGAPTSGHVVYYFHGIGGNETRWQTSSLHEAMNEKLARSPELRPHVFSVSFGRAWFFTDVENRNRHSRISAFLELLPSLEASIGMPVSRRTVAGQSMGGYNALRFAMEMPSFFQQVISLCPALLPVGPYASREEIEAFKARNREYLNVRLLETLRFWVMTEFPSHESWVFNNPLDRSVQPSPQLPPVYLSQYLRDEYAFAEGTTLFASNLRTQGLQVNLRTVDAKHCKHSPEVLQEASAALVGTP